MPTSRANLAANVVNGKIYLMRDVVNEVYDPVTDSWTTRTPNPLAAFDFASAVVDNRIYVIGGFEGSGSVSRRNQIYDPENDSWSSGASLSQNVVYGAAGATTGAMAPKRVYVFGATGQLGIVPIPPPFVNQVYDPANGNWTIGVSLSTSRINLGVVVMNDTLYAIGGHTYEQVVFVEPSSANEQYLPFGYGTIPPEPQPESFPVVPVAVASAVVAIVAGGGLLFYFRKRRRQSQPLQKQSDK